MVPHAINNKRKFELKKSIDLGNPSRGIILEVLLTSSFEYVWHRLSAEENSVQKGLFSHALSVLNKFVFCDTQV